MNDPLNNTKGDRNILQKGSHYLNNGGNSLLVAQALATWCGLADEAVMPFQPYSEDLENEVYLNQGDIYSAVIQLNITKMLTYGLA